MNRIVILTPTEAGYGFTLAGVRQREVAGGTEWAELQAACADPAVGVVAADARLLAAIDPPRLQELTSRWAGVLVTLPAPSGTPHGTLDDLQRLIRRALGYHIRLEP